MGEVGGPAARAEKKNVKTGEVRTNVAVTSGPA